MPRARFASAWRALPSVVLLACGSSEAGGLTFGSGSHGGTAGAAVGGATSSGGTESFGGGLGSGGAFGASGGAGGTELGSGGAGGIGGDAAGAGGASGAAGTAGSASTSDAGKDAAPAIAVLPSGGVISAACAACATDKCQTEAAACQADQECWDMGVCVTKCIFPPQCAACFVGSQKATQEFTALQCCTGKKCSMCPSLNGGVIGCP